MSKPTETKAENSDTLRKESHQLHEKLLAPPMVRKLSMKSDYEAELHMAQHVGLWALFSAVFFYFRNSDSFELQTVAWVSFVAQCFVMSFLFMPEHECCHQTCFADPRLNNIFGHFLGFSVFRPFRHYRFYHFNHHKFTGDPATDPEMQDSFIDLTLDTWWKYALYLSSVPYWIDRFTTIFRHGVLTWILPREDGFLTDNTRPLLIQEARAYVLSYSMLALVYYVDPPSWPAQAVLWGWFIPTLFAQPFLRFYLIAEHTGCPIGDNMLSNTRTTKTWGWYRWLAWNMPYHAEHHAYPTIPFWRLPELHEALSSHYKYRVCNPSGEHGYLGVHIALVKKFMGFKVKTD